MSPQSPSWTLHQLETAYRQGYLEALLARKPRRPHHEVLAASWEAGWRDANNLLRMRLRKNGEAEAKAPRPTPRLTAQIRGVQRRV
ncbi:hypothetical protein QO207_07855 [Pseudomonas sp. CAN2814]|uniref:ribosome modulation factor n=1 Tax=Pseudomonas sp. CAN1 TaxID=3046726 RepID=UPI0026488EE9|nr:hypothetical protein [Pseudomonas sp. CAN1]MDN6856498.1 hypothetical protein [Pseudomonas sp. CAN1]